MRGHALTASVQIHFWIGNSKSFLTNENSFSYDEDTVRIPISMMKNVFLVADLYEASCRLSPSPNLRLAKIRKFYEIHCKVP